MPIICGATQLCMQGRMVAEELHYICIGATHCLNVWGHVGEGGGSVWAVFVEVVALRHPAGVFLVPPQLHPSILKPSLDLHIQER